ncbi:hypothetical protein TDB9533_03272 [Thalassocella blandensis]|nr:hypothetical protein TDB9533_03272 [Thalassocella blandensis]
MKIIRIISVISVFLFWGCASNAQNSKLTKEDYDSPIKGTDTAVVQIGLDEEGMPFVENDSVVVTVGQRIVLVGPFEFSIRFPKGSPFEEDKYQTRDAVMNFIVPLELEEQMKKKRADRLVFKYDIIAGDKVLDPMMIILPR